MTSTTTVLITGCSGGFGRLTAESLARRGCRVFGGVRDVRGRNRDAAAELGSTARREGLALTVVELDVTDDVSVAEAIGTAGDVDVLVNNAGVLALGPVETFTPEKIAAVFGVNVLGALRVARAVLPGMRHRGSGLIVQVSSVLARYTLPGHGPYCASKAALEAFSECLHEELAGTGVDVAILEPGPYPTGIGSKIVGPDDPVRGVGYTALDTIQRQIAGRFAAMIGGPDAPDPREVAEAIAGLIGLPAGSRPLRTVVGRAVQETRTFNDAAAAYRRRAHAELGLADPSSGSIRPAPPGPS